MYCRLASAWNAALPLGHETHSGLIGRDGHFFFTGFLFCTNLHSSRSDTSRHGNARQCLNTLDPSSLTELSLDKSPLLLIKSQISASNDCTASFIWCLVTDRMGIIRNRLVFAWSNRENHRNLRKYTRYTGRDSNTTILTSSVKRQGVQGLSTFVKLYNSQKIES